MDQVAGARMAGPSHLGKVHGVGEQLVHTEETSRHCHSQAGGGGRPYGAQPNLTDGPLQQIIYLSARRVWDEGICSCQALRNSPSR